MPDTVGIAACGGDPDLMFPMRESDRPGEPTTEERRALAVCGSCPVLRPCRIAVLDTSGRMPMPCGVAGGLTAADRRALRAAQRSAPLKQAREPEGAEESGTTIPAPRVAPDVQPARASRPVAARAARAVRPAPPPSASAPAVTPAALAMLNRAPDPGSSPTPARNSRTKRTAAPAPVSAPSPVSARAVLKLGDELDELIVGLLRAYPVSLADAATVRELVLERGPAAASRWEVAIAAMTMLARDTPAETTARLLGEDGRQVRRWRERRDTGRPLVLGGAGTGTHRLLRPARLVATTNGDVASAATFSAVAVDAERGAA